MRASSQRAPTAQTESNESEQGPVSHGGPPSLPPGTSSDIGQLENTSGMWWQQGVSVEYKAPNAEGEGPPRHPFSTKEEDAEEDYPAQHGELVEDEEDTHQEGGWETWEHHDPWQEGQQE